MKVTINQCLDLEAFEDAQIVAGQDHLDRNIKSVSVMETSKEDEILKYCAGNEQLMLTSFADVRKDVPAQCKAIEALAKSGNVGAILFRVGDIVERLDEKVIETAELLDFPLIVMGGNQENMGEVITQLNSQLFYGSASDFGNNLISNTIFHLLNFEKYSNFQAALRGAAINNNFQVVIVSHDFNPIMSVETRHKTSIQEAIGAWRERGNREQIGVYTMKDINGILTYWGPVSINGERNFMLIVDNEDSYSPADITKLAEIVEIAMGMWRYTPETDSKAELIKALRRGNRSLAYTISNETKIKTDQILSVFFAKGLEGSEGEEIISDFGKEGFEVMRVIEEEETYGMILSTEKAKKKDKEEERRQCIDFFGKIKGGRNIRMFHVTGIDGLSGAIDAYQLINETSPFVESVYPYKRVFSKYELSLVSNCISMQLQGALVKKTYLELLAPLDEVGEAKAKQLLETLETFVLDAGMNSGKTAEAMGIHANTVQYRLKRINDLLGAEITGNRIVPSLTIALALRRIEKST